MKKSIAVFSLISILTGCATVTGEKSQPILVKTTHDNVEISGVGCTLSNDSGSWFVTTPASVQVRKSTGDMAVDCKKEHFVGNHTLVSKSNTNVWGNIILGGVVGYVVDRQTGAGFDYPTAITVPLRQINLANSQPATAAADVQGTQASAK